jgi:hypothetical protein
MNIGGRLLLLLFDQHVFHLLQDRIEFDVLILHLDDLDLR